MLQVVQLLRSGNLALQRHRRYEACETQINSGEKFSQATRMALIVWSPVMGILLPQRVAGLVGQYSTHRWAIAIDRTRPRRTVSRRLAQSLRVSYSKLVSDTHTYYASRYRISNGYWSFREALPPATWRYGADPLTIATSGASYNSTLARIWASAMSSDRSTALESIWLRSCSFPRATTIFAAA
jgi:hypothetical protein